MNRCFVFWHKGEFWGYCRLCHQPRRLAEFEAVEPDRSLVRCPRCRETIAQESDQAFSISSLAPHCIAADMPLFALEE